MNAPRFPVVVGPGIVTTRDAGAQCWSRADAKTNAHARTHDCIYFAGRISVALIPGSRNVKMRKQ
jgi:hypothetical protein